MKRFIPAALIFISIVPLLAGLMRVFGIVTGTGTLEGHARFAADPVPAVLHIIGLTFFATFGALQFSPALRRQRWHRLAGRVLAPMGIIGAICGVWMALTWPPKPYDTVTLNALRVMVALSIATFLAVSVVAARWGDFEAHARWMIRAYALALAAGTQFFTQIPVLITPSLESDTTELMLMSAGWLINIAVAEWVVRCRANRSRLPNMKIVTLPSTLLFSLLLSLQVTTAHAEQATPTAAGSDSASRARRSDRPRFPAVSDGSPGVPFPHHGPRVH